MKIVLIIYAVSWLIELLVYLLAIRKNNSFDSDSMDSGEKWAMVLAVLFAPIVILIVPFILINNARENRRDRKAEEKRNREKDIENEYCDHAIKEWQAALSERQLNPLSFFDFNAYITSLRSELSKDLYIQIRHKEKYSSILDYLPELTLPKGASLHVEECKNEGLGDNSKLFIETPEGVYDYNIWDYISVDNSEIGAWSAYLLFNLWHVLPKFWHANYNNNLYLFEPDYIDFIEFGRHEETDSLRAMMKEQYILPDVIKSDNKYYVSCCYFNKFRGLMCEVVEITLNGNKASFHKVSEGEMVPYDCGIRY